MLQVSPRRIAMVRLAGGSVLVLSVLSFAAAANAQEAASTFEELRFKVKEGDTVYVTGDDGREREASIVDLSGSSLIVSLDGDQSTLTEGRVKRMRQRLPDGLWNGALIGFLVGGTASTAGAKALESPEGSCGGGCVAANVLYGGGVGALIGVGLDALRKGKKTIYEPRQPAATIVLQPVVLSGTLGFGIDVRF